MKIKSVILRFLDPQSTILIKNSSWVFVANSLCVVFAFIQSILLARELGSNLYGLYLLASTFVLTIQEFLNPNIGTALIKYSSEYKTQDQGQKVIAFIKFSFLVAIAASLISLLFVFLATKVPVSFFQQYEHLDVYLLILSITGSFASFDYVIASLQKIYDRFFLNSILRVISAAIELIGVFLSLRFYPQELLAILLSLMCSRAAGSIIMNIAAIWDLKAVLLKDIRVEIGQIRDQMKEIWSFILSNSASRTLQVLTNRSDVLILGTMAGAVQVAYYATAKKLAYSILVLTDPLFNSSYPQMALLVSEKRFAELKVMLINIVRILAIPISVFTVLTIVFRYSIIAAFYGYEYLEAANSFAVLVIAASLGAVFFWQLPIILAMGETKLRLKVNFYCFLCGIASSVWLARLCGAYGVAIVTLGLFMATQIIFLHAVLRSLGPVSTSVESRKTRFRK